MYKGLFIDDSDADKKYAKSMQIEGDDGLLVEVIKPDTDIVSLADIIYEKRIDLLALDYRLDEIRATADSPNRYKAGPLAQYLRDQALDSPLIDFPIILVSQEENLIKYYLPDLTSHDLFDKVYTKSALVKENTKCKSQILSLIRGYKFITKFIDSGDRLSAYLNIIENESGLLDKQYLRQINSLKAPHQISKSIFRNIIGRPGLLIDRYELFARLGVDPSSPDTEKLLERFSEENIVYRGVFSDGWQRWWDRRLAILGERICCASFGELTADVRVKSLNSFYNLNLLPAKSRWSNKSTSLFSFACASCKFPTEIEYSVSCYDPVPLEFMQKKRICWKCLQTGEYKKHGLNIDESDTFIADKIENGKIQQEIEK